MALVVSLQGRVSSAALDEAEHLIDHGEAPEGIRVLAWALADSSSPIEEPLRREVIELMDGTIEDRHLPTQFHSSVE